jgi:hypothetical protein
METEALGRSLVEAFARVPDPRGRRGQRHPMPAILTLAAAAMLSGARSLAAITEWGRAQEPVTVHALGFTRTRTPAIATLHEVFKRIDAAAVEAALGAWAQAYLGADEEVIASDGKALRGTYGEQTPGLMTLAAFTHGVGRVLAQTGDCDRGPCGGTD